MRHCLIPFSLALTLAVALVGCGTEESPELGLEACQSYCETFFIKYGECVEAMSDDTRSTAISTCFEEIQAQERRGRRPGSDPRHRLCHPRSRDHCDGLRRVWGSVFVLRRPAGGQRRAKGEATSAHQPMHGA